MQGYNLTFSPKVVTLFNTNFCHKFCPFLFPVNFRPKCKAITLLFGQKLSTFQHQFLPYILSTFTSGKFWAKMQGFDLTFWPKIVNFFNTNFCHKFFPLLFPVKFQAKLQGYNLTFLPKIVTFFNTNFCHKFCPLLFPVNIGPKCKAITLPFFQKLSPF